MPEHRDGTPEELRLLESFLWHDFDAGEAAWAAWLRHRGLAVRARAAFADARMLHAALQDLQAVNAGLRGEAEGRRARQHLNGLIDAFDIRPRVAADGGVALMAPGAAGPVAELLVAALGAMQSGAWRRFKLCREAACHASFYDASKAAGKIWCDMGSCGSQNKMRRYRARQ
jgi:predicted RNA-binding Zn ribbon-like protein